MAYVKISDPQVIDLAAWHQVINVVNQHSDSIDSVTNNLGAAAPTGIDYNGSSGFVNQFDPGSQKMLYGKVKLNSDQMSSISNEQIYYGDIDFVDESGTTAFSANPIVTGTIQFGHTSISTLDDKHYDFIFNIFGVTASKFSFRVNRAIAEPNETNASKRTDPILPNTTFYLNWTATGPK
jgi:hypothetical protein